MRLYPALIAAALLFASPALAQTTDCRAEFQALSQERGNLFSAAQGLVKKKAGAGEVCSVLGKIVENGSRFQSWINTNKDWCQLPDELVQGLKKNHDQTVGQRRQVCAAAKQQASGGGVRREGESAPLRPLPKLPPKL